ncbi:MAG: glycosyl hydrolase, partial [Gemmatimonadaceae bacterium]
IRGNVSHGDGVWKTTDAGKTWTYMGLKETQYISRIRIDPGNPDVVYVGALGHVFGPNPERGVYRTTDGGKNWKRILFRNDSTGIIDLILDPSNSKTIYAAFWQAGRTPWSLVSGGAGSGMFKSTDGGDSWKEITRNPGLPQQGAIGNIGITVSAAKPNRIWALIEHEANGGVYRSDDAGATWTFLSGDRNLRQRAWYFSKLYADPKDTNVVYAPNVSPMISKDGGKTFARGWGGGDNHDIWIDPTNPARLAMAHDNGVIFTTDSGKTSISTTTPTGQYYHVHLTSHFPYHVCGAKQDAGSSCGPVRVAPTGGRGGDGGGRGAATTPVSPYSTFYGVAGGESGYISSNPVDPDIMYGANYGGSLSMLNMRTGQTVAIDPWPLNPMGHDAKDSRYRFQWTYPIVHSPHDPNTIYVGSNVVFRSTNGGLLWTPISPDLTRHDPRTLGASGGPITKDQTSVEYYGTVFTIAESPRTKGVIWTGSDDGLIYLSRDNGVAWKNVTPKGLPDWMRWSIIEASPHATGTAFVAGNRYQMDDFAPYLYKTTDYGVTWTKIVNGITADNFTRSIREDLYRPGLLYASTERGVWISYDAGSNWKSLQKNLPPVPVHDMMLRDDDLVIATHGRAFWVMEGLAALRWAPEETAAAGKPFLYKPAPVFRLNGQASPTFVYRLPADTGVVKFELFDKAGKLLLTSSSSDTAPTNTGRGGGGGGFGGPPGAAKPANRAGINRFTWPMRYKNATTFRNIITWAGSGNGPAMDPGTYKVTMTAGRNAPVSEEFVVKRDPRSNATDVDLFEQTRFALQVRDRITQANEGVITIRNLKREMDDRAPKMASTSEFADLVKSFSTKLGTVEDSLYQTKNQSGQDPLNYPIRLNDQMGGLMSFIAGGERRPPKQSYDVYAVLGPKLDAEIARLERVIAADLPKVNAMLKKAGQPEIVRSKVEPPLNVPKPAFVP